MDEPFTLTNEPPPKPRPKFDDNERTKQAVLFAGMDALPGQMDLFDCDGPPETDQPGS